MSIAVEKWQRNTNTKKDKDDYKDENNDNDKDEDAKRITETLTVCYIFGILIQCSTTQYRQVPLTQRV